MTNLIVRTTKTMLLLAIIATLTSPIFGTDKALPCLKKTYLEKVAVKIDGKEALIGCEVFNSSQD